MQMHAFINYTLKNKLTLHYLNFPNTVFYLKIKPYLLFSPLFLLVNTTLICMKQEKARMQCDMRDIKVVPVSDTGQYIH